MEPIILTEEHKSKLIEMCKILFPEYGEVQLLKSYISTPYDATGSPYLRWYVDHIYEEKKTTKLIEIHWFEFCSIHLLEKLYRSPIDLNNFMSICFRFTYPSWDPIHLVIHPVDYLYEEFLKLKS